MNSNFIITVLTFALILFLNTLAYAGNIDPDNRLAWGENVGWINFAPTGQDGVTVSDDTVSGLAWGENIGWVNLSPENSSAERGVKNDGNGNLSGFAYCENTGWINFDPVQIDPLTGLFTGKAWGENTGWISFNFADTSKKVVTSWRKVPGDVTGDGNLDLADAVTALKLMISGDAASFSGNTRGDINEDGKIGMAEVSYILQRVAGLK